MSDSAETFRKRVLEVCRERDEFFMDVDGFHYLWPKDYTFGHFSAAALRVIADELDRMNNPWQDEIEKYFADKPDVSS